MNEELSRILGDLRSDPALVVSLYEELYNAQFWLVVAEPASGADDLFFLTYPADDGVQELPVFTSESCGLLLELETEVPAAMIVMIDGPSMWAQLRNVVKNGECEVAVDPGEPHGIRISKEMLLGMLQVYGGKPETGDPPN